MNQQKRPNIIVFMTDHQRGDTILADSPVKTPTWTGSAAKPSPFPMPGAIPPLLPQPRHLFHRTVSFPARGVEQCGREQRFVPRPL